MGQIITNGKLMLPDVSPYPDSHDGERHHERKHDEEDVQRLKTGSCHVVK
jgi:hypothetical protein